MKPVLLIFPLFFLISCSSFEKRVAVKASYEKTRTAIENTSRKLNYDMALKYGSHSVEITLKKYCGGKLKIVIDSTNDNPSLRVRSYNSDMNAIGVYNIFIQSLSQELEGKVSDSTSPEKLFTDRKSYPGFLSLTLLNSGFGLYYSLNDHPYYSTSTKWIFSLLYAASEGYFLSNIVMGKKPYTNIIYLLLCKFAVGIDGSFDIRNYNDIVDSGYTFRQHSTEKTAGNISFLLPVCALRF